MAKLTEEQLAALRMFRPNAYSIKLGPIGRELWKLGLVEWRPSWMPGGADYAITEAGRAALATPEVQPSQAEGE